MHKPEYCLRYRQKDPEAYRAKQRARYKKSPQIWVQLAKKWKKANPEKNRAWQKKHRDKRTQFLIDLRKEKGGKCFKCGYSEEVRILQFHHLRDKLFEVSQRTRSIEAIRAEAEKCVLLCPNCHFITHLTTLQHALHKKLLHSQSSPHLL